MFFFSILICFFISFIIVFLFYLVSKKVKYNRQDLTSFECGFSMIQNSNLSFSIHYLVVALIFLILDLELCILFPLFLNFSLTFSFIMVMSVFVILVLLGLIIEWWQLKLNWIY